MNSRKKVTATVLDKNFIEVDVVDDYVSFIWTGRFDEAGDFELCIPVKDGLPEYIKKGYYLWNEDSDRQMIIESISVETDPEEVTNFIITGHSLESILKRRIVWNKKVFSATTDSNGKLVKPNLQNGIETLLNENVINPAIAVRKIPNFIFKASEDERITKLTFEAQYLGEDLYTIIHNLCRENEIGFKLTLSDDNQLVFELCVGEDRSYAQDENPYVVFSPNFDNILNTKYLDSDVSLKNVTLVVGEHEKDSDGNTVDRREYTLNIPTEDGGIPTGIDRREIFTDATSLSTEDEYGGVLSAEAYQAHLKQKGIDTLMDSTTVTAFEGEIDATSTYVYGEDFNIGDIVQIANEYGQEGQARVSEFVISSDQNGVSTYPTFQSIQKGVYET